MRSGAACANNSDRFNDGLGTTYGRGLLAASGTVLGPYFEKDLGIYGFDGISGGLESPFSSTEPEITKIFPVGLSVEGFADELRAWRERHGRCYSACV
jgi:hypothetical protein